MIAALTAAILTLCTFNGSLAPHLWQQGMQPHQRARQIAEYTIDAGKSNDVDPYLMIALMRYESHFDESRVSKEGAFGLMQLNPKFWGRDALRLCIIDPVNCDWWNTWHGAQAIAHYKKKCGSEGRALVAYRTGRCGPVGPRARLVLNLRRELRKEGAT